MSTSNVRLNDESELNGGTIVELFNGLGHDHEAAIESASEFETVGAWKNHQSLKAAVTGAAAGMIPGVHWVLMGVDLTYLIHLMATTSWGVGEIHGCTVEPKEDLAIILGYWSHAFGPEELPNAILIGTPTGLSAGVLAMQAPDVATKVGGKVVGKEMTKPAVKCGTKAFEKASLALVKKVAGKGGVIGGIGAGVAGAAGSQQIGGKISAKISSKIMAKVSGKVAGKIGTKVAAKAGAGIIPFVGGVVGGTINVYFVRSITRAADDYYAEKRRIETDGPTLD